MGNVLVPQTRTPQHPCKCKEGMMMCAYNLVFRVQRRDTWSMLDSQTSQNDKFQVQ